MKANQMNYVAKDIRINRQKFESIVGEFRAYWGKVYRNEVTVYLNEVIERQKTDKSLKAERYAIEQVCAKIKGLNLSDEVKSIIKSMHDDDKLTFACLTPDYIKNALQGLDYVNADGDICEFRKASKDAAEKTWCPVEKWTESKLGRYFRLAAIRISEQNK